VALCDNTVLDEHLAHPDNEVLDELVALSDNDNGVPDELSASGVLDELAARLRGLAGLRSVVKSGDVGRTESYSRYGVRLNYYPSTRYVAISKDHPRQGKTQMKNLSPFRAFEIKIDKNTK
jgi:hypothetical protein